MGSPNGFTVESVAATVFLWVGSLAGAGTKKAAAVAVTAQANTNSNRSAALTFNLSPPSWFFGPKSLFIVWKYKKHM
jgi:hypothetical protein